MAEAKNTLYCSFCKKSQHEVKKLIAGPNVFICNECVKLCAYILGSESVEPFDYLWLKVGPQDLEKQLEVLDQKAAQVRSRASCSSAAILESIAADRAEALKKLEALRAGRILTKEPETAPKAPAET